MNGNVTLELTLANPTARLLEELLAISGHSSHGQLIHEALALFKNKLEREGKRKVFIKPVLTSSELGAELWAPIADYPSYEISNLGRIKSVRFGGKLLNGCLDRARGYIRADLSNSFGKKLFLVHRLVAQAFLANPGSLTEVNHRDGNKANNAVSNLEWVTNQQNINHALESGIRRIGEGHHRSKLTDSDVRSIRNAFADARQTVEELAAEFNVKPGTIRNIVLRKSWFHLE